MNGTGSIAAQGARYFIENVMLSVPLINMRSHYLVFFVLEKNNFTIEKHFITSMINCFVQLLMC